MEFPPLGPFSGSAATDGAPWTPPHPPQLLGSDSPVGLVRLSDGRLVLLWNKCLRFPYAHGGDHGTAYPYPVVLPDDTILVTTGQGEGRLVVVAIAAFIIAAFWAQPIG